MVVTRFALVSSALLGSVSDIQAPEPGVPFAAGFQGKPSDEVNAPGCGPAEWINQPWKSQVAPSSYTRNFTASPGGFDANDACGRHVLCLKQSSVIQANCRARFTAADFDFVVRTLSQSQRDRVSLVDLLAGENERDQVLDHEGLVAAILSQNGQLAISPQFYFYVLARHVLRQDGIEDRRLCDYVGSLLDQFSRTARLAAPGSGAGGGAETGAPENSTQRGLTYLSDLLLALQTASAAQAFLLRAHVGNYALFLTGIFHEAIDRRSRRRGAPDCTFYEEVGRTNFRVAAGHEVARRCELSGIFDVLAAEFRAVRLALNRLADRLLNLGDDNSPTVGAGLALIGQA